MSQDFGIIIACCDQDYSFAKGCCASIRYFLGDVPLCLIVDGKLDTLTLERIYDVKVINKQSVSSEILRTKSFGFGLTKMVAFWESPWKNFLFLDADTVTWFNILKFANFKDYDVIIDKPDCFRSDKDICSYFFDTAKLERYFPSFDWRAHRNDYFCTGVFFASRDIFSLDEYAEILDLVSREPQLFLLGEQGLLNFMLCRAKDNGKIRLGQESIQIIVPDCDQQKLQEEFSFSNKEPFYSGRDVVIHWCGPNKPVAATSSVYSKPMTFFRQKFLQDVNEGAWSKQNSSQAPAANGFLENVQLRAEDIQRYIMKYKNKVLRKLNIKKRVYGGRN